MLVKLFSHLLTFDQGYPSRSVNTYRSHAKGTQRPYTVWHFNPSLPFFMHTVPPPPGFELLQGREQSGGSFNGCLLFIEHYVLGVAVKPCFSGFCLILTRNSWDTSPFHFENSDEVHKLRHAYTMYARICCALAWRVQPGIYCLQWLVNTLTVETSGPRC